MIEPIWRLRGRTVLLVVFALFAMQVAWWWVPTPDGAAYLSMARGIAHGRLERLGSPQLYYAPGYPLLVSPLFVFGDRPFLGLSLAQLLFTLLAAWLTLRWMRRLVGESAPILTLLAFVNVGLWALFRATLSELAFLALVMGTAECLHGVDARLPARRAVLGAALLALAVSTRQAGLALVAGMGVVAAIAWLRRVPSRVDAVGQAVVCSIPAAGVFLFVFLYDRHMATKAGPDAATYASQALSSAMGLGAQLLEGLRLRMAEIGRLLVPGMHKAYAPAHTWLHVNTLVYGVVAAFIGLGWVRAVRARRDVLLWAAPFYVLLYVIWPFDQGTRFLAPLLPVWIASLWFALGAFPRIARFRRAVVVLLLLAHLGVAVGVWVRSLDVRRYHALWPAVDRVVERVGRDGGAVKTLGLDRRETLMLELGFDRPLLGKPGHFTYPLWLLLGPDAPGDSPDHVEKIGPWRLEPMTR